MVRGWAGWGTVGERVRQAEPSRLALPVDNRKHLWPTRPLHCPPGEFADANKELLETIPPPLVAAQYYTGPDIYMFDAFQTSQADTPARRPKVGLQGYLGLACQLLHGTLAGAGVCAPWLALHDIDQFLGPFPSGCRWTTSTTCFATSAMMRQSMSRPWSPAR